MWNRSMIGRKQASMTLTVSVMLACFLPACGYVRELPFWHREISRFAHIRSQTGSGSQLLYGHVELPGFAF